MGYTHGCSSDTLERKCTQCHKILPNTHEYFNYANKKTGRLNAVCKDCTSLINKQRNQAKREEHSDFNFHTLFYDEYKRCKKCERELPHNYLYFPPDKTCAKGLRNVCRECSPSYSGFLSDNFEPVQYWTDEDITLLKNVYPHYSNSELVEKFFPHRTIRAIETQANLLGVTHKTEETRARTDIRRIQIISEKFKGRVVSEETKQKLSSSIKEYYKTHDGSMKGVKLSPERCEQISQRMKGKWAGDKNPRHINPLYGEQNGRWDGGINEIKAELRTRIPEWKNDSMQFCNFKCVITGGDFKNIHHTTPFHKIMNEAFILTHMSRRQKVQDYSNEEMVCLEDMLAKLHMKYGFGACINESVHKLFHDTYGYIDCNILDFCEFMQDIINHKYDDWFQLNHLDININVDYFAYITDLCASIEVA